jgi:hypothetical protein
MPQLSMQWQFQQGRAVTYNVQLSDRRMSQKCRLIMLVGFERQHQPLVGWMDACMDGWIDVNAVLC